MRNSKQRNEIFEIISNSFDHPNAETIYMRVKKNMPNISLGTVYRNLCVLVNQGVVRQICIAYGPDRYDKTLEEHSHFFCQECGEVSDIGYDIITTDMHQKMLEKIGHKIDGVELMFNGICKNCLKNKELT